MALAVVGTDGNTWTTRDQDSTGANVITTYALITPSGSYSTGGDTLDLTSIASQIGASGLPLQVDVYGNGNTAGTSWSAIGNYYATVLGTAINNFKMQAWQGGGTQLAAGAYPATVTNDKIILQIAWRKFI